MNLSKLQNMSVCLKDIGAVAKHDIFSDMNNIRKS